MPTRRKNQFKKTRMQRLKMRSLQRNRKMRYSEKIPCSRDRDQFRTMPMMM